MYKIVGLLYLLLIPYLAFGQSVLEDLYQKKDVTSLKQYINAQAIALPTIENDTLELLNEIYNTVLFDENSPFYLDLNNVNENSLFIHQNKIWLNICELRFLYEDKYFNKSGLKGFAEESGLAEEFTSWNLPDRVSFRLLKEKSYKFYRKILESQLSTIRDSGLENFHPDQFIPYVTASTRVKMVSVKDEIWREIFLFANDLDFYPPYHFSRCYGDLKPVVQEKYRFLSEGIANFAFHQQGEKNAPQLPMEIFLDSREDFAIIYLSHGAVNHHLFLRKVAGKWTILENVFGYLP